MVPSLLSFDPSSHVKLSDMQIKRDCNNLIMRVFYIPKTKTSREEEDILFTHQTGSSDPEEALLNNLRVNEPSPGITLFSYCFKNGHRPLMKQKFIGWLAQAAKVTGLDPLQGHEIHIGSMLDDLQTI
ncbi:hypothetical protein BDR06DRAFT_1002143 [Suillus hirtellus]|nr:hypothetical protein BDR06DRAFT_1002143 [Suillus hirtellus]